MSFVTVVGNVGDVQLKFTPNGKAVCEVRVAENHNRKNEQTGQWETESTTWRRVTFWENQAEAVADQIQKGDRVIITGDERLREYERNDGSKGASLEVRGRHIGKVVMPLSNQPQQQGGGGFNNAPQSSPAPASNQWGNNPGGTWAGGQAQGQGDANPPF